MIPTGNYILMILLPLILATITTPLVRLGAIKNGIVEQPGLDKHNQAAKPLLGGLAIYFSVMASLLLLLPINRMLSSLMIASVLLIIVGYLDDRMGLKPLTKLTVQLVAAAIVVMINIVHLGPLLELFGRFYLPWYLTILGMVLFITLMINAFNLIDGMDGLAAGVASILFIGMAVKSVISGGSANTIVLPLIGFGSCVGFLPYNINPAKIIMGDTGSMLLGFLLSTTFLFSVSADNFGGALVLGSVYIFAYPLLDVAFAIYRRVRWRCSILQGDLCHIHHIFEGHGYSVRRTVGYIYLINMIFVTAGVTLIYFNAPAVMILVAGILTALAAVLIIRQFAYMGIKQGRINTINGLLGNGRAKS